MQRRGMENIFGNVEQGMDALLWDSIEYVVLMRAFIQMNRL